MFVVLVLEIFFNWWTYCTDPVKLVVVDDALKDTRAQVKIKPKALFATIRASR